MTSQSTTLDSRERQLLNQAAEWRLLSLLFECPNPAWQKQVAALAVQAADPALSTAAESALTEASEGLYHSTLGPGSPAPAREVSYHESVQLGYLMSELAAFYEAFAYQPSTSEVVDHVSVLVGFVAYLRLKEAYALASADPDHAAITAEAARQFIDRHLSLIAQPLAMALSNSGVSYLSQASAALLQRVGPQRTPAAKQPQVQSSFAACGLECDDPDLSGCE